MVVLHENELLVSLEKKSEDIVSLSLRSPHGDNQQCPGGRLLWPGTMPQGAQLPDHETLEFPTPTLNAQILSFEHGAILYFLSRPFCGGLLTCPHGIPQWSVGSSQPISLEAKASAVITHSPRVV